jgi:ParB family chromosome partitioning protein
MELRKADPASLKLNPANPRRIAAPALSDEQLAANIRECGLIQPPLTFEEEGALTVIAGSRRVKACIMAGLAEIDVLVCERDDRANIMQAFAENMMRTGLGTVDQWRGIEALVGADWTEDAIAVALSLPMRTIKRVRLCAHLHPAILDQMAKGDEPRADELRLIAAATPEEQAQAWKKHKPKKGETTLWHSFAAALRKDRMPASAAAFDAELAKAYGIVWQEDLFAAAD